MSPPELATVKSTGSTNQLPVLPLSAKVVMRTSLAIFTLPAEVSMKPASPPLGALASKLPPTSVTPEVMSPNSRMRPPLLAMVCACTVPLLRTTLPINTLALRAVITTKPPSALTTCLFSTKASITPWSICTAVRLCPLKTKVVLLPAAMATVPSWAMMTPSLRT